MQIISISARLSIACSIPSLAWLVPAERDYPWVASEPQARVKQHTRVMTKMTHAMGFGTRDRRGAVEGPNKTMRTPCHSSSRALFDVMSAVA
ncbi:hypothetical protein DB88DRAFT_493588 [Papiliotrema laurentii]|uniref:Uncharacterized protein n=1 Tax=Papiliotrema laurentii TaxID=5418 RepID=A0AAD9CU31_PAPLA|nr:hypothetical protein DB88DRAFT_503545 [Papiliotrema laurentii]KAK1923050.1 hypothetical protein DB88DRAFT_493588 [Papiliotrema laurentii]